MVVSIIQLMPLDNQITHALERLSVSGIKDVAQAAANLRQMAYRLGEGLFSSFLPTMITELTRAADPDMAINNLERLLDRMEDPSLFANMAVKNSRLLASLITIFGASRFLSQFIISSPEENLGLMSTPDFLAPLSAAGSIYSSLRDAVQNAEDYPDFVRILRRFRKANMLRIGIRDLMGLADLQETMSELSDLAEACLQVAYERIDSILKNRFGRPMFGSPDEGQSPAGFSIIAMGKLGGRELNFSSDIDLMYVYSAEGETEGVLDSDGSRKNRISNHQYFVKLSEMLTAAINEKTADGFVFRVDLRLRPEGQRGSLCQSLNGYEIYYESWGQTWERAALLKARPVAGDHDCGKEFIERITPFIFRKYLDFGAIAEIRELKVKINKEVEQKGRLLRDVKLGYGGIREVEFIVQALQLIYGGRERSLRERNTLRALHVLSQKGLITYVEHDALAKAYVFLRNVEHRIQILEDLQTQTMPSQPDELRSLARRMGYHDPGNESENLLQDYKVHTKNVRAIYDELFAFTGERPVESEGPHPYVRLLDPEVSEHEASALLERLRFKYPSKAFRNLMTLREGPAFTHQTPRGRRRFNEIFPALFDEIVSSADPDSALNRLESYIAARGSWDEFHTFVSHNHALLKIPVGVFSNSEYFSRMLVRSPELLDDILDSAVPFRTPSRRLLKNELSGLLAKADGIPEKMDAIRRFKNREEIRIGMADIMGLISLHVAWKALSRLADVCLDAILGIAFGEIGRIYGLHVPIPGLAVIGLGKFGGREITYGSDLDVAFVFSDPGNEPFPQKLTAFEYYNKVAEKAISYLTAITREGILYRVDVRLRPGGSKGPLAQSVRAFSSYYGTQADTWELQVFMNARVAAGDHAAGEECLRSMKEIIYRERDSATVAQDVRKMRMHIEGELGRESQAHYNIKQGRGGLLDIEFLVQFFKLVHGASEKRLRLPGTYNPLKALPRCGLIDPVAGRELEQAYVFIRTIESRLRIVTNQPTDELPRDPDKILPLAKRVGYADDTDPAGLKLLRDYEQISGRVRQIFDEMLSSYDARPSL